MFQLSSVEIYFRILFFLCKIQRDYVYMRVSDIAYQIMVNVMYQQSNTPLKRDKKSVRFSPGYITLFLVFIRASATLEASN